jgi:hypothetical protein
VAGLIGLTPTVVSAVDILTLSPYKRLPRGRSLTKLIIKYWQMQPSNPSNPWQQQFHEPGMLPSGLVYSG